MRTTTTTTTTEPDTTAAPPPPAAAALDDLEAEALALEGAGEAKAAAAVAAQEVAEAQTNAAELLAALEMARMMAAPAFAWWPDFGACWSDRQLQAISTSGAAVMVKHGMSMGELMGQWGPYIALAGATIPPALATHQAIRHRKEQAEADARQARQAHQQAQQQQHHQHHQGAAP